MNIKKGINLGGWLSQCENDKNHFETFVSLEDYKKIKELGFDHVRVPMDWFIFENEDGTPSDQIIYAQRAIDWAKETGLNMILDVHKAYGYAFDEEGTATSFFNDPKLVDRFVNMWKLICKEFVKYKDFVVFELLNEVTSMEVSDIWNDTIKRIIANIRKVDKDVKIIIGGTRNNSSMDLPKLPLFPGDKNVIYTFHCYDPLIYTHQGAYWIKTMPLDYRCDYPLSEETKKDSLRILNFLGEGYTFGMDTVDDGTQVFEGLFKYSLDFAKEHNVELYCGEYGVINLAENKSKLRWFEAINKVFEKYNINRCMWSYREMDFGFIDEKNDDIRSEWIKFI